MATELIQTLESDLNNIRFCKSEFSLIASNAKELIEESVVPSDMASEPDKVSVGAYYA